MSDWRTILYSVLGALAVIAIIVIIVVSCLICKEKREKRKKRRDKKNEKKKDVEASHKKPGKTKATHPDKRVWTKTERVQPTTDSETGRKTDPESPNKKISVGQRRAVSAMDGPRTSGGYQRLDDTTSQEESEGDSKSGRSSVVSPSALLDIPIPTRRTGGSQSSYSASGRTSPVNVSEKKSASELDLPAAVSEKLGSIFISLHYDFQDTSLVLKILRGKKLAAKDLGGTSDPYVRIMLLPDKKHKLETKVKHKSLNPVWNETFLFERFPYEKLRTRTIHLEVLDKDRFTSDDPIGEVFLPLVDMNLAERCADEEMELVLKPIDENRYRLGEILVALAYDSNREKLTLTIMKCRDLKAKDISTGSSDPFVKVWQMRGREPVVKRKTTVLRRNLNPVFNETFPFDVPFSQMRETSLQVTVRDHDTVGVNETIGCVILGSQSGLTESRQWTEMMAKGKSAVSAWHVLKKDFGAKE